MAKDHDWHDWHSDECVDGYVEESRRGAATRKQRFDLLVDLIPFEKDDPIAVLDVGGGHGPVSALVLAAFPKASVTLHDYSEPMLGHARALLAPYADRVSYVKADLFSRDWLAAAGGPFQAVVSASVLHNLQDPGRLCEIYNEIHDVVGDSGCFLNLDIVKAPSPELQVRYGEIMYTLRERETAAAKDRGETVERWSGAGSDPRTWEWPPYPSDVDEQLTWLLAAGFTQADCFWKHLGTALVGGFK
jgi:tRNA (cmo5U34)-methyltransferase